MLNKEYKIGPTKTFLIVKILIFTTLTASMLNAIFSPMMKVSYLDKFLSLSPLTFEKFYLWQFFTYSILESSYGINVGFLFNLGFNLYLFWIISTEAIVRTSKLQFGFFYFISIILTGFFVFLSMLITKSSHSFTSISIPLYIVLIGWMMLVDKNSKIFLFFAIPIKLTNLVLIVVGFSLFTSLSNMNIVYFTAVSSSVLIAYFYSVIVFQKNGPIKNIYPFENKTISLTSKFIDKIIKK